MLFFLYKTTNKINNKYYYGFHITESLEEREKNVTN